MKGLERTRVVFIVLLAIFALLDVALAIYLFWPGASSQEQLKTEEQELRQQLIVKTRQAAPFRGIDQKLVDTRAEIKKLYQQRVPEYWSQIASELHKLEVANGVTGESISYKPDKSGLANLQQVEITTGVAGDYLKIAHFINALEREPLLLVIEQVSVSGQAAGTVQLQIKLQTFLKGAA